MRLDFGQLGMELVEHLRPIFHQVVALLDPEPQLRRFVFGLDPRQMPLFLQDDPRYGQRIVGIRFGMVPRPLALAAG